MLFVLASHAAECPKDGMIPVPVSPFGSCAREDMLRGANPKDQINWFGGEIIVINGSSSRYARFSDDISRPMLDYSGTLSVFKDHVCLDHPGLP